MNNRGEEIMVFPWIAIFLVIGIVVVIAVVAFTSGTSDVRVLEADLLSQKFYDCFVNDGYLKPLALERNLNVFEYCSINRSVVDSEDSNFEFEIKIYNSYNTLNYFKEGESGLLKSCNLNKDNEQENLPICSSYDYSVLFFEGSSVEKVSLKISVATHNLGRRFQ